MKFPSITLNQLYSRNCMRPESEPYKKTLTELPMGRKHYFFKACDRGIFKKPELNKESPPAGPTNVEAEEKTCFFTAVAGKCISQSQKTVFNQ